MTNDSFPIDCGDASEVAVDPGIHTCSPVAAGAKACWAGDTPNSALCLGSVWDKTLRRHAATAITTPVRPAGAAQPLALELDGGIRCVIRNGGSWPSRTDDPTLTGAYSCGERYDQIVWASSAGAIDRNGPQRTVRLGTSTSPLRTVGVTVAYTVGTAA